MIEFAPVNHMPAMSNPLPPFGQVNYANASSISVVEFLFVIVLWLAFAVALLRRPSELRQRPEIQANASDIWNYPSQHMLNETALPLPGRAVSFNMSFAMG